MSEAVIQPRDFSGAKLRELRLALKVRTSGRKGSQSWLAYTIGAHVTSISDWERGVNQPSPRHLDGMARALECDIDDLFAAEDSAPRPFRRKAS